MAKKKDEIEMIESEEKVITAEEVENAVDDVEAFIENMLKTVNRMTNRAKAERLASRLLKNRKGK